MQLFCIKITAISQKTRHVIRRALFFIEVEIFTLEAPFCEAKRQSLSMISPSPPEKINFQKPLDFSVLT
jgi:hypothetical protein